MSLFDYKCNRLHVFSEIHPIGEAPDATKCPDCGTSAKRVVTAPSVHFRGQGFSRTSAN